MYAYCENNPVMYVDPSGNFALELATGITILIIGIGIVAFASTLQNVDTSGGFSLPDFPDIQREVFTASALTIGFVYMSVSFSRSKWDGYMFSESEGAGKTVRPEAKVQGSGKHGINWKEGAARAKATGNPQGQWAEVDLDYATEIANSLRAGESGIFDLPEGSESIIYNPDGTTQPASKSWIRNNGTGTWPGYPMP